METAVSKVSVPRAEPAANGRVSGRLTGTAWLPGGELRLDDWIEHGRRLGVIGRASSWWIGDWLRYGNTEFGDRYARASRITGYDVQTLMNMVYVATAIPPEQRRETLSWSHHAELAALPAEERARWLDLAEAERMSVRCLRAEVRRTRPRTRRVRAAKAPAQIEPPRNAAPHVEPHACPHCGHDLLGAGA